VASWKELCESVSHFWARRPALWIALQIYLGFIFSIQHQGWIATLFFLLLALPLTRSRQLTALAIWIGAVLTGYLLYRQPELPKEGWHGKAEIQILSVSPSRALFGKGWSYRAQVRSFTRDGEDRPSSAIRRVPVYLSARSARPPAHCDYRVEGTLLRKRRGYALKTSREWTPIPGTWSLAETRRHWHERVEGYFKKRMRDPEGAALVSGLLVGDFCDVQTLFDFGQLGLQHMMAISGFHFSMIAISIAWILRLFMTRRVAAIVLGALLTLYLVIVGLSPATHRAWAAALVTLSGVAIGRTTNGLNTLGIAGIVVLLSNPVACGSLAFQFSFAATGAILLYYPLIDGWLRRCFTSYPLGEAGEMRLLQQHAYLFLLLIRRSLALLVAVHLAVVPMTLCIFHSFSLLGLFYNLLFPFLLSSLILTLPWIALGDLLFGWGFSLADWLTGLMLDMAHYAPVAIDYTVRADWIAGWAVGGWLLLLLFARMRNKDVAQLESLRI
jgi:competence protein ComEC